MLEVSQVNASLMPASRWKFQKAFEKVILMSNYIFSLLPSAGREMNTSQNAVTLWGWGIKALVDKRVGGRYNCAIPR